MIRLLDIILAFLLLPIAIPFILLASLLIVLIDRNWPLFFQWREGKDQREFLIFKLQTMRAKTRQGFNSADDLDRVTKLGIFLRKTSIDELPQVFNVLSGSMSFVGPRPLLRQYSGLYPEWAMDRFLVKPGISGLAQIKGRTDISWRRKFRYDVFYAKRISVRLYLYIILSTVVVLVKGMRANNAFATKTKYLK